MNNANKTGSERIEKLEQDVGAIKRILVSIGVPEHAFQSQLSSDRCNDTLHQTQSERP